MMIPEEDKVYYPYEASVAKVMCRLGKFLDTWGIPESELLGVANKLATDRIVEWVCLESYSHPVPRLIATGEYIL